MKMVFLFLTFAFVTQSNDSFTSKAWKIGETKEIYNTKILRLEGKNDVSGVTNVAYKSFSYVISEVETKAKSQMWLEEEKQRHLDVYNKASRGGQIQLYISRLTIDAANTEMFTVVVKDSTDNFEILRKPLKQKLPNAPRRNDQYWWNTTIVALPDEVKGDIYIYVVDKLVSDNNIFKFKVNVP